MSLYPAVNFTTFGMFIIDEIEWLDESKESKRDLIGGAGTYAVIGARLVSSPCQILSRSISWIVDTGSDFPEEIKNILDSWNTHCTFRDDKNRLTTRAWNGYGADNDHRDFKYLTSKVRLDVEDFGPAQLHSRSFHAVCSSERFLDITGKLFTIRPGIPKPLIIWEPIPDLCVEDQLAKVKSAVASGNCSIVSPNAEELAGLFGCRQAFSQAMQAVKVYDLMGWPKDPKILLDRVGPEEAANAAFGNLPVVIVREGAQGSTAYFYKSATIHVPAFHSDDMPQYVVDPTGAGNTYLGAVAMCLTGALVGQPTHDLILRRLRDVIPGFQGLRDKAYNSHEHRTVRDHVDMVVVAMIYATVAAGCAVEQHGMPVLEQTKIFTEIHEKWNGRSFLDRVKDYLDRLGPKIIKNLVTPVPKC